MSKKEKLEGEIHIADWKKGFFLLNIFSSLALKKLRDMQSPISRKESPEGKRWKSETRKKENTTRV